MTEKREKHVVALIPRGEVIRNFVYSGCLDLVAEDARVSILAVEPNESIIAMLAERYGDVYRLAEAAESYPVRFQREILDMAHGRWLWSEAAQERWRLRDVEARTFRQKAFRTVKKAVATPFASRAGLSILSAAERTTSRLMNPTREYLELFNRVRPSLVFNGSHIHSRNAIQAVQSAQWLGIPTATFIFSWDNLTSQGRITLPYDYYFVWNEKLRTELLAMYPQIKPENVFVTGTPQFDFHFREEYYWSKEEFCRRVGADAARPIIFYSTGMPNHMPDEPVLVEEIADRLLDFAGDGPRPQLMVRVYAKDQSGRFDDLRTRRKDILFPPAEWEPAWLTPKPEDSALLVNSLRHCDVGINIASTLSLELCMFDKPVINLAYDPPGGNELGITVTRFYEFDHYKPIVESGAIRLARSTDEVIDLIRQALDEPSREAVERRRLIEDFFGGLLDGNAAKRIARRLISLSEN